MRGLKVGHTTHQEQGTGVSVFLFENNAVGAYSICGSAPASHELNVLDPENSVPFLQGLVFSGGSAYGLFSAQGVMRYFTEHNIGHPTPHGVVPIVPAAAIYDLAYKKAVSPTADDAYQACLHAHENNTESGAIGAGCGATVGKLIPHAHPMKGGLGYAEITLKNGLKVCAYAVVNCVGDVRDEKNNIIAGAIDEQKKFVNCEHYLLSGHLLQDFFEQSNSTLVAVFTNAAFSKAELKRITKMAIAGMARAVSPIFTRYDGDMIFCISVGDLLATELTVGTMAAEVARQAIVNAVKDSN